jgi:hypothetical protein
VGEATNAGIFVVKGGVERLGDRPRGVSLGEQERVEAAHRLTPRVGDGQGASERREALAVAETREEVGGDQRRRVTPARRAPGELDEA